MSDTLRKLIRELIEEEMELEETTSSGAAGPYNTPYAFRGNTAGGKEKAKKNATQAGYEPVNKTPEKADDVGDPETRVVSYGEKGPGGLKKPKDEPKPKIEENKALEDRIKHYEDKIKQAEKALRKYKDSPSKKADVEDNIKKLKANIITAKRELSKKNESLQENRYNQFKMQEGTPSQKIGKAIREINRQISEVDRVLRMNERLKNESGINGDQLWKSTARGLTKLESRMNTLSARIRNLKS